MEAQAGQMKSVKEQFETYLIEKGMDALQATNVIVTLEKDVLRLVNNAFSPRRFASVFEVGRDDIVEFILHRSSMECLRFGCEIMLYHNFLVKGENRV